MNIIGVTVDVLPRGCSSCKLSTHEQYICLATGESTTNPGWIKIERPTTRLDQCPLTIKKPQGYFKKYKLKEGCYDEYGGSLPSVESEE